MSETIIIDGDEHVQYLMTGPPEDVNPESLQEQAVKDAIAYAKQTRVFCRKHKVDPERGWHAVQVLQRAVENAAKLIKWYEDMEYRFGAFLCHATQVMSKTGYTLDSMTSVFDGRQSDRDEQTIEDWREENEYDAALKVIDMGDKLQAAAVEFMHDRQDGAKTKRFSDALDAYAGWRAKYTGPG